MLPQRQSLIAALALIAALGSYLALIVGLIFGSGFRRSGSPCEQQLWRTKRRKGLARLEHNFISDRTPVSTHFHRFRVVRVASMLQGNDVGGHALISAGVTAHGGPRRGFAV